MAVMPARWRRAVVVAALGLCGLLGTSLALWLTFPQTAALQELAGSPRQPAELPWSFTQPGRGNYLSVYLPLRHLGPRRWHFSPSGRLTALSVNGQPLRFEQPLRGGFDIDLSPWLHDGDNELEFRLDSGPDGGGLMLRPLPGWRTLALAAGLLPWLLALARLFRLRRSQTLILCGGLLLLCVYWSATSWSERNYDVRGYDGSGHLGYAGYVAATGALPAPGRGWEFFQPPLYYLVAAAAWRWALWLNLPPAETLQALALGFWLVFLAASAAALRIGLRRGAPLLDLATAVLALWPSGIIHGLRIGNDVPLYAAAAVATYCMLRWWRGGRLRHLYAMALAVAAALLCKTSASAVLAAAVLLLGLRLLRHGRWRQSRAWAHATAAGAIMLGGLALGLARGLRDWLHGQASSWLIGNIDNLDADLAVTSGPRQFLLPDLPTFLASPWIDSRDDASGRANFWNYLLRSSLTGEFQFDGTLQRWIALSWGALLLALLILLLLRTARLRWSPGPLWRELPWLALGLLWLASVLSLRIRYSFACEADFRFVVPALLPLIVAGVRHGAAARAMLGLIAAGSAVFFMFP